MDQQIAELDRAVNAAAEANPKAKLPMTPANPAVLAHRQVKVCLDNAFTLIEGHPTVPAPQHDKKFHVLT
jgi:hypothetical protein